MIGLRSLLSLLSLLLLTLLAAALELHFDTALPRIDADGQVTVAGMFSYGRPGAPAVPVYPVQLLLPPGTVAREVTIEYGARLELGTHLLTSIQQQWPAELAGTAAPTLPDSTLWSQPGELPEREPDAFSTQWLAGHSILLTHACPVRYDPLTRRLSYYRDFTVRVELMPAECRFLPAVSAHSRVAGMVDNPQALQDYTRNESRTDSCQYLVVAPEEMSVYFQQLVDWRNSFGMRSQLVTIEEILANWDGVDDAERLRNFLIAEYQEQGFRYLLLGGDIEQVPYRGLFVHTWEYDDDLPSDLYFAALDGNWDENQNGIWGEEGEEDWLPELAVGRASVSTIAEAANFVNKQIDYQSSPVSSDLSRYLMIGEQLDSYPTWGGDCKDEIRFGATTHNLTTVGLPANLEVELLYDRESSWTIADLFNQLDQGVNLINHLGHCSTGTLLRMHASDVNTTNLTANGFEHNFHIGYSQGCHAGAFDSNDCIMERVTNLATGFAAFIGNSRYGWYWSGSTGGASQLYDREFFDAIFGEGISILGEALQDSREDLVAWAINDGHMRWVYYEMNLFGDPALQLWSREPFDLVTTYEEVVSVGLTELPLQVNGDGLPAEGLRAVVLLEGTVLGSAVTDGSGNALIEFAPALEVEGTYELVISGWNCLPTHLPLDVTGVTGPYLVHFASVWSDTLGNNNGLPEAGEQLQLLISLLNVGVVDATAVNATLSSNSGYLVVTQGWVTLPDIPPGGEANAEASFELTVASHVTDLLTAVCVLTIWCDGGVWSEDIELTLHLPQLQLAAITVSDEDNERLDPGETAPLELTLLNNGSGWASGFTALLESADPQVTVDLAVDSLSELLPAAEAQLLFQLTADPETEPGDLVTLELTLTPPFGPVVILEVPLIIGQRREGFETGDFSSYEWTQGGDADWYIESDDPFAGSYCARSGVIGHSQSSQLSIYQFVLMEGTINFHYRVSSQPYFDLLRFYIDEVEQMQWSGSTGWGEATFFVPAGWHTYTWSYSKSINISMGSDCAWLDAIIFPPSGVSLPPAITLEPAQVSSYAGYGGYADAQLQIGNQGEIPLEFTLAFDAAVQRDFSDDMENGEGGWSHDGPGDPWHLSDYRSHTPEHSWYLGQEESRHYLDGQFCRLVSPAFMAVNDSELRFWHWGEMETADNEARDGGFLLISVDGGDWQLIEPVGGYPCQIAAAVGSPFPEGTGCYSGVFDWEEALFDLSPWAGDNIRLSFMFGSNPWLNYEGWYLDDLRVTSDSPDWISYQPSSGVLFRDDAMTIYLQFHSVEYADTLLTGNMLLSSNDPEQPEITIPIVFEVGPYDQMPLIAVTPIQLNRFVEFGDDTTAQLLVANQGIDPLEFILSFSGTGLRDFFDDMENGENGWTHDGLGDPWHLSTHRSHSAEHAWYPGQEDLWLYEDNRYCRLVTPPFGVTNDTELRFWHWGEMEADTTAAFDGGMLEIAVNGGEWQSLVPVGGYPCTIAPETGSPFTVGTGCWSGTFDWVEEQFDLNRWAGDTLQVGFLFGSNATVTGEGWYIDDLQVAGTAPAWITYQPGSGSVAGGEEQAIDFNFYSAGLEDTLVTGWLLVESNDPFTPSLSVPVSFLVGPDEGVVETQPLTFRLEQNYPNPFNPTTRISFCLPEVAPVRLEVYDLRGRLVSRLIDSVQAAGEQTITFEAGNLAAGIYFYRITTPGFHAVRKMLVVK